MGPAIAELERQRRAYLGAERSLADSDSHGHAEEAQLWSGFAARHADPSGRRASIGAPLTLTR